MGVLGRVDGKKDRGAIHYNAVFLSRPIMFAAEK
jgi:hypothetical protein